MPEGYANLETPLLEIDDYNGRLYHLNLAKSDSLDLDWLIDELSDRSISLEDYIDRDIDNIDDLHVPPIFEDGLEDDLQLAKISGVDKYEQESNTGIIGYLARHDPKTVQYDNREVLVINEELTKFLIFERESEIFLLVFANRKALSSIQKIFDGVLSELGFVLDEVYIGHSDFNAIAQDLIDTHLMTSVNGYPETTIHKKEIIGRDFRGAKEFEREKRQGEVSGHRFGTEQLDGQSRTIQISEDCLIRSYHNISLDKYLSMISRYIIPNLTITYQTSVTSFDGNEERVEPDRLTED